MCVRWEDRKQAGYSCGMSWGRELPCVLFWNVNRAFRISWIAVLNVWFYWMVYSVKWQEERENTGCILLGQG